MSSLNWFPMHFNSLPQFTSNISNNVRHSNSEGKILYYMVEYWEGMRTRHLASLGPLNKSAANRRRQETTEMTTFRKRKEGDVKSKNHQLTGLGTWNMSINTTDLYRFVISKKRRLFWCFNIRIFHDWY